MAFYKVETDYLLKAESDLFGPGWNLFTVDKDIYTYPVEGWWWFDTDKEAEEFFGMSLPQPLENNSPPLPLP